MIRIDAPRAALALAALLALLASLPASAHEPPFTAEFDRERCTFTTVGSHPYFPLWPGLVLHLEGEEEDEGETIEIEAFNSVLAETELVDGVLTRVYEERELEDGELVEVSRNFFAVCRETGDVWYFGEDVDDYEDGEIVGHGGAWRSGIDGAEAGVIMPGSPLLGARYFNEIAPGIALDQEEVVDLDATLEVPAGTFEQVMYVVETSPLDGEGAISEKWYGRGIGYIKDDALELVEVEYPDCLPDATTHCLDQGRFRVTAEWRDFQGASGGGQAILGSADSGEFWFFAPDNTELLVKVFDACDFPGGANYWVFAAGLTNVEVTLTVTDTAADETRVYVNPLGAPFAPILDTTAFATCP